MFGRTFSSATQTRQCLHLIHKGSRLTLYRAGTVAEPLACAIAGQSTCSPTDCRSKYEEDSGRLVHNCGPRSPCKETTAWKNGTRQLTAAGRRGRRNEYKNTDKPALGLPRPHANCEAPVRRHRSMYHRLAYLRVNERRAVGIDHVLHERVMLRRHEMARGSKLSSRSHTRRAADGAGARSIGSATRTCCDLADAAHLVGQRTRERLRRLF
jgi:plasmid stabilization system protein ParE